MIFAGDVSRRLGALSPRGAPAWPVGVYLRSKFHSHKQPFPERQLESALRRKRLADLVARRPRECGAEGAASDREEYPGSPDTT